MTAALDTLKKELVTLVETARDPDTLEAARVLALGKKGKITELMKGLGGLDPETLKAQGAALNVLKDDIAALIDRQERALRQQALDARLKTETVDVTLSPRPAPMGTIHPISQTMAELVAIFASMGFVAAEGPDIEDDFHNFTALNFPPGHPAREMQDTFFLPDDVDEVGERAKKVLRTHTSPVQIRHMLAHKPPLKIVCFGRVYRADSDMTHTPMFHQMEALMIGKDVTMGHLKGCLQDFVRAFFGVDDLPVRFRPSYFPFTEPSAEVDLGYVREGNSIRLGLAREGQEQKWMEVLGSGMVHPNVLKNCGVNPDDWQGFAFGAGLDRLAMLKYGIPDLRDMFACDTRWLTHYGFDPLDPPNLATGAREQ